MSRKLLFIYNADSGRLNTAFDMAHKLISPSTYKCNLCSLTHGVFSERELWKAFREASGDDLVFLHRDEFEARYPEQPAYPVILLEQDNGLTVLLSAEEIRPFESVDRLINELQQRLD